MFYMASTQIKAEKTAMEIQYLLGSKGASQVLAEYEDGKVIAISFVIIQQGQKIPFRMPVKWEGCLRAMKNDKGTPGRFCNEEQAKRTAWRINHRWLKYQNELIEAGQAELMEVMLAYVHEGDQTFYERIAKDHFKMLPDLTKETV
jgi:hypothetical protein